MIIRESKEKTINHKNVLLYLLHFHRVVAVIGDTHTIGSEILEGIKEIKEYRSFWVHIPNVMILKKI